MNMITNNLALIAQTAIIEAKHYIDENRTDLEAFKLTEAFNISLQAIENDESPAITKAKNTLITCHIFTENIERLLQNKHFSKTPESFLNHLDNELHSIMQLDELDFSTLIQPQYDACDYDDHYSYNNESSEPWWGPHETFEQWSSHEE